MKRIIAMLLLLALTIACVPTPEEDFIVNRAEEQLPKEADESVDAVAAPISVPAHASLNADPTEHVTVVVDADVSFDPNAPHPIIEVEALDITKDAETIKALLALVGPGTQLYEGWPETKDDVGERLQSAMQYDGQLGELVMPKDEMLPLLQMEYNAAPETREKIPVDMPQAGKNYYLERSDGTVSALTVNFEPNDFNYRRDIRDAYYTEDFIGPKDPIVLTDPEISEADARKEAEAFIKTLGAECDCLVETQRGFSIRYYELHEMLWRFMFVRSIDGTPSIGRPNSFMTSSSTPSSVGAPWFVETAWVYVGRDGVVCVNFSGASKAKRVVTRDAQLCDFDKALDMGVRQIGYLHDGAADKPHHTYTVTSIDLVYGLQAKQDDLSVGVYQPMWEFTYVDADEPDEPANKLYISALTGGHVEPRVTVKALMRYEEN